MVALWKKKSVAEVIESVRLVGRETGFQKEGEAEAKRLEEGFEKIRTEVAKAEARAAAAAAVAGGACTAAKKKVAFLEWLEPLFNGGHWIPDMVRAAGGEYTMAEPGESLFKLSAVGSFLQSGSIYFILFYFFFFNINCCFGLSDACTILYAYNKQYVRFSMRGATCFF